jgi:hypothetical protein
VKVGITNINFHAIQGEKYPVFLQGVLYTENVSLAVIQEVLGQMKSLPQLK